MKFTLGIILLIMMSCNQPVDKNASGQLAFQWSLAGALPADSQGTSKGVAGPVAGILDHRLLIGGGSNFPDAAPWDGGIKKYYDNLYVFEKKKDSLICVERGLHLPYPVGYAANCSTPEGVIVAGGENEKGALNKVLLISDIEDSGDAVISYLPDLPLALTNGMITADKGVIYFAGGENQLGVSNQFYCLNLGDTTGGWKILPELPYPVTNGLLLAADSSIYLVGGRKRNIDSTSNLYHGVYCYDMTKKKWSQKASLPYALSAQTGVTWNDSTLLVFSGDKGKTFHETEKLLMEISRAKNAEHKQELIRQKNVLQKDHPGFESVVLAYHIANNQWKEVDSIPFPGQVTTTALKWDYHIIIPCGEIRAGVRTPDIILGTPKF